MGPRGKRYSSLAAARPRNKMQERQIIRIEGAKSDVVSPAVKAGGFTFVSAVAGLGEDGKVAGPDITSQTKRAIDRLGNVLTASGSSLSQAVSVHVYLRNSTDFDAM